MHGESNGIESTTNRSFPNCPSLAGSLISKELPRTNLGQTVHNTYVLSNSQAKTTQCNKNMCILKFAYLVNIINNLL